MSDGNADATEPGVCTRIYVQQCSPDTPFSAHDLTFFAGRLQWADPHEIRKQRFILISADETKHCMLKYNLVGSQSDHLA